MSDKYQQIMDLQGILLEESYVLDIRAHPSKVEFKVDFVLTPEHREYRSPGAGETYCTKRGLLIFSGVTRFLWSNQGAPPARDATGEVDFGHIDSLQRNPTGFTLEGDWGHMDVLAQQVDVQFD